MPPLATFVGSADGSPFKVWDTFLKLTLGDITRLVEALVLPSLGADIMILDNNNMGAFGAVLDKSTEQLTFKNAQLKLKASHRGITAPPENPAKTQCSVDTVDPRVEPVLVLWTKKCHIHPDSEMAAQVYVGSLADGNYCYII